MSKFLEYFRVNERPKRPLFLILMFSVLLLLVASSGPAGPNLVRHPYLQLPGAREMTIVWATRDPGVPSVNYGVDWGDRGFDDSRVNGRHYSIGTRDPLTEHQVAQGVSTFYPALGGYYQHEVRLTGLQPATRYSYRIFLDDQELLAGGNLSFRTPPKDPYFTFVAFGDSGTGTSDQIAIKDQLLQEQFDLAVLTGDIAYEDGTYAQFQHKYFDIYREMLGRVPFVPALGNHEYFTDSAQPFLDLFVLPQNGAPGQEERYFSFDYGNVHFVSLDSERVDETQADWLRRDLEASSQFWKVVYLHRPLFGEGSRHSAASPEYTLVRTQFAPIFEEQEVDLVLSGHNHLYGRSVPLINAQAEAPYAVVTSVADGGVVYVTTGGGGGHVYQDYTDDLHQFPGATFAEHHYTRVTIANCDLSLVAIDKQGRVRDEYNINRCPE